MSIIRHSVAWLALGILVLAAGPLPAETLRIVQGPNSWEVRALHDVVAYDLTESAGDPTNLPVTAVDVDSPLDVTPGSLRDGQLWFYRLEELGRDVASFYGYNASFPSSASSALAVVDTARVFLHFDDTNEALALVFVLDAPNDGGGGQADLTVSGLPDTAVWSVLDDPGEPYTFDPATGIATASWNWLDCCTDGGAISGLEGRDLVLSLAFTWRTANGGRIQNLEFLSGTGQAIDDYDVITLNPNQPFDIEITQGQAPVSFEAHLAVLRNEVLEAPRMAWPDLDRLARSVDPTSTVRAQRYCVMADGITPARVLTWPQDAGGTLLGPGLEVTPVDAGLGPGSLSGPVRDLGGGAYVQEVVADLPGPGALGFEVDGNPLTPVADLLFVTTMPEVEIVALDPPPYRVGERVCFQAEVAGGVGVPFITWDWNGDGEQDGIGIFGCPTWAQPGTKWVRAEVRDDQNCWDRALLEVEVMP